MTLTTKQTPQRPRAMSEPAKPVTFTSKILIMGYGRHGKDTVAEMLAQLLGVQFTSSSRAALEEVIYPVMQPAMGYTSLNECFEDRVNHRAEWYDLICNYNSKDPTRLARKVLERSSIYVGMRSATELQACKHANVFDHIVWVDASRRLPPEPESSCTVTPEMAHCVLNNNGTLEHLETQVRIWIQTILDTREHE